MNYYLKDILSHIHSQIIHIHTHGNNDGYEHSLVGGVTDDSRWEGDNSIFVAISGSKVDGHEYIGQLENNIVLIIGEKEFDEVRFPTKTKPPYVQVSDSRLTLAAISHFLKGNPSAGIKSIGVTGTNGKTTVSYILHYLLSSLGKEAGKLNKSALIGTTGIFIGNRKQPATHTTPSPTVLAELYSDFVQSGVEYAVMEVSSHALHQHRVHGISFSVAVFTNLTQDHLDYHGNMDDYANAKKILFDNLESGASAVVYSGDPYSDYMVSGAAAEIIKVGFSDSDDYYIKNYSTDITGTSIRLIVKGKEHSFTTNLIGKFNVINSALSIATLASLGWTIQDVAEVLKNFAGVPGRMEIVRLPNGALGIVDYAHTPDALENALTTINHIDGVKKVIVVFGCGGDRDKSKRPQMGEVAYNNSDICIITSDNPRTENPNRIMDDIITGSPPDADSVHAIEDRATAIRTAYQKSQAGDIILVAGKGHEDYQVLGTEKVHFSDREVLEGL